MEPVLPIESEIHLWFARLDVEQADLPRLRGFLAPSEIARAERFRVPAAARRFIAARARLRQVLGRAMGCAPNAVEFRHGTGGKPTVAHRGLHFNASDSGELVVVALAGSEIGVDLELRRELTNLQRLAERICTDAELRCLLEVAEEDANDALLRLWTVKEAALKAVGTGLPGGLRNIDVDFGPDRPPRLRSVFGDHDGWRLLSADRNPDVVCSVVVRASDRWSTVRHHWLDEAR